MYFTCFGLVSVCFITIRAAFVYLSSIKASLNLHENIIYRIVRTPINLYLDKTPIGRIINRIGSDLM